jgi:potassium-transporting ATPase KdpC subunit
MRQVRISISIFIIMSALLGLAYPLAMTGITRLLFPRTASGSLVTVNGRVIGSELIGQNFTSPRYFHGRPSAAGYDAGNSGGSSLGPTNKKLIDRAVKAIGEIKTDNGLPSDAEVPSDLVLASGSGLDPHIRPESALLQANRIAGARGIGPSAVRDLVLRHMEKHYCGLPGRSYINVLTLNMALDAQGRKK